MDKKSFLKGLLCGVGATALTALLGLSIYGLASSSQNGTKASGNEVIVNLSSSYHFSENYYSCDFSYSIEDNGSSLRLICSNMSYDERYRLD